MPRQCPARRRPGRSRPAGRTRHLTVAGLTAELAHELVDLAQARGADRLTVGDEAAVGVDRHGAVDLGGAVGDELLLVAVGAEAVLGHVDDLRAGVGVLELDHVDVLGPDARPLRTRPGRRTRSATRPRRRRPRWCGPRRRRSCGCGSRSPSRTPAVTVYRWAMSARHSTTAAAPSSGAQNMYWVSG